MLSDWDVGKFDWISTKPSKSSQPIPIKLERPSPEVLKKALSYPQGTILFGSNGPYSPNASKTCKICGGRGVVIPNESLPSFDECLCVYGHYEEVKVKMEQKKALEKLEKDNGIRHIELDLD